MTVVPNPAPDPDPDPVYRENRASPGLLVAVSLALGGIGFWLLDVSGALLWATMMVFLSRLPAEYTPDPHQ